MKLVCLLLAAIIGLVQARDLIANLNPAQSGCYGSTAIGNAVLTLRGSKLCVSMSYTGLSGPELAAHIHGPAKVGIKSQAGVLYTLKGGAVKTPGNGNCFTIDSTETQDLLDGLWYFAVHTELCPNGELRGQIYPV